MAVVPTEAQAAKVPSISGRLARALLGWALVWGLAVGLAVWMAAVSEVDELLDEGLMSSATLMASLAQPASPQQGADEQTAFAGRTPDHFAWQLVAADGRLLLRSPLAPAQAWHRTPAAGFSNLQSWRLYGLALPGEHGVGRMLYTAQTRAERGEARADVALSAALAALAVGLLGQVWLRARVRAELQPLQALSERLGTLNLDNLAPAALGTPQRRELAPVHRAVDELMARLALRMGNERAFSAHAAHALRTPLAGIDAQLALALRDATPPLATRLQRVRDAAGRLQGVVAALLGMFRAGTALDRRPVDVADLLARLPTAGLQVQVQLQLLPAAPPGPAAAEPQRLHLQADADLLAAALANLLDNSQRHGATCVQVSQRQPQTLHLQDDGPGVPEAERLRLQQALDDEAYEGVTGLGLMLADRVARAHGGRVRLPPTDHGFAVELSLLGLPPGSAE